MMLPPHVKLYDALAKLREEIEELQRGIEVVCYPGGEENRTLAYGAISMLIGDHPQQCENATHLGVPATKNCRSCMVSKQYRTDINQAVTDFHLARSLPQATAVKTQMIEELGSNPTSHRIGIVQGKYGLSISPFPFEGLVDPFRQAFPCVSHAIDLGLMLRLISFMMKTLSPSSKRAFQLRVACLDYPRKWSKLPSFTSKFKGKLSEPMKVVKKLSMFGHVLFAGLVDQRLLDLLFELVRVRSMILDPHHTDETIEEVLPQCVVLLSVL